MRLGRMLVAFVIVLGVGLWLAPPVARPDDQDLADPTRKPGGINPADVDWRCSIMAGREDRAYLNCQSIIGEMTGTLVDMHIKIDPPPWAPEQYGAGGKGGIAPPGSRRR